MIMFVISVNNSGCFLKRDGNIRLLSGCFFRDDLYVFINL